MAEVINLRQVRKRIAREKKAERAAENRVLHGIPRTIRTVIEAKKTQSENKLDQHRIDTGDGE